MSKKNYMNIVPQEVVADGERTLRYKGSDGKFQQRAKTGIFIEDKPVYWDGSTIVNKARLVTDNVIYHREQKERLDNLCRIISEEWEQVDPSSVSATWLDEIVDRFNHPEKYVTVEEKDDAAVYT